MSDESAQGEAEEASHLARVHWPWRTRRLSLRPATAEDTDAVWGYRRLAEVSRWLGGGHPDRAGFADDFIRRLPITLVIERRDETVIGDLMVRVEDGWAQRDVADRATDVQAELGWVFHPDHAGQGYATEAVHAMIGICFGQLGLRRVTAHCFAANESSWRLMERVGMRRESHTREDSLHRELGWQDGLGYALLASEWMDG